MNVAFYQLTKMSLEQALPKLLEKIYGSGMRALVLCDLQKIESLNTTLWTYSSLAFLPHGYQGDPQQHPIWLSNSPENVNDAQVLVITNGQTIESTVPFEKSMDLFDGNNAADVQLARARYRAYQARGDSLLFWKQDETGAWQKQK